MEKSVTFSVRINTRKEKDLILLLGEKRKNDKVKFALRLAHKIAEKNGMTINELMNKATELNLENIL